MSNRKTNKTSLYVLVFVLCFFAIWRMTYKVNVLGYSVFNSNEDIVWTVEAQIEFDAYGGSAKVDMSLPPKMEGYSILSETTLEGGYGFNAVDRSQERRGVWSKNQAIGPQKIYYRIKVYDALGSDAELEEIIPEKPEKPIWEVQADLAVKVIIDYARKHSADSVTFAAELFKILNSKQLSDEVSFLLEEYSQHEEPTVYLAMDIFKNQGIPVRSVLGVPLRENYRHQALVTLLEIYEDGRWIIIDPKTGSRGLPKDFLVWNRGGNSLIDVFGGHNTTVRFSAVSQPISKKNLGVARAAEIESSVIEFSLYSLPVEQQNVFKKLLVVPLGALIVVIIRNIIGLSTSGTFMPILIAIALLETELIPGLTLLVLMVSVGLAIRSYLSQMDLLLVPRISAVVIIVITIMAFISIISFNLRLDAGMGVTFFPIIIIAWTIERLSIAIEEQGIGEVGVQFSGSVLVAVIIYTVMSSTFFKNLLYTFPEINLIILSAVLLIGTYTGFRLSELRRFEPLVKDES